MIFYGTNSSTLKNGRISNVTCPNCEKSSKMNYTIFGKYFYIYWIPIFPVGRVNVVECIDCKATYDIKNLDQNTKNIFQKELERNPTKTPIKLFSGLIIGLIVTVIIVGFSIKADEDSVLFAKNPKVGDIFYETTPSGQYSTSKVVNVTKDSVYVLQNNLEIDRKSNISKTEEDKNYQYPYTMSRKQVVDFLKKGDTIYKIERK